MQLPVDFEKQFAPFRAKMLAASLPELSIRKFYNYYKQLLSGESGMIPESSIHPVESLADADELGAFGLAGQRALRNTVIIKLNGGLGTSMGLDHAKVLLPAKHHFSFLDLIVNQILDLRTRYKYAVPVIFMNSLNTHDDTRERLAAFPDLAGDVPLDFLQHRVPKIDAASLAPVSWPSDHDLEWSPPGHGDIYSALSLTGLLDELLARDFTCAFVANADNLGAVMNLDILGYFVESDFSFLMEVADRTPADKKGGHLACLSDGRLTLREVAQCPADDLTSFEDINRYRYFNTNSIWLNLEKLRRYLTDHEGIVDLPMIRNLKTVDPTQPASTRVIQLETAMGAAISMFPNAMAVRVPRSRFMPVKTCQDLVHLWSDQYILTEDYRIIQNSKANHITQISLDPKYFRMIHDVLHRFPEGAPSLVDCESLVVEGDVRFGANVKLKGWVKVINPNEKQGRVPDGIIIENAAFLCPIDGSSD